MNMSPLKQKEKKPCHCCVCCSCWNRARLAVKKLIEHKYFDNMILVLILFSSIILVSVEMIKY